jgi:hypothetical protein
VLIIKMLVELLIIALIIAGGLLYFYLGPCKGDITKCISLIPHKQLGDTCVIGVECADYPNVSCCGGAGAGICTTTIKDWTNGIKICPSSCLPAPSPLGDHEIGKCGDPLYAWPRPNGGVCDTDLACASGKCCDIKTNTAYGDMNTGICSSPVKDWAGNAQCPSSCLPAPSPLGSWEVGKCGDANYSWPRPSGGVCDTDLACASGKCCDIKANTAYGDMKVGTCGGVKDWAGNAQCPSSCVAVPAYVPVVGGVKGQCGSGIVGAYAWPRQVNQECSLNTDCQSGQNLACCSGYCKPMMKDYTNNICYCPEVCVGTFLGKPGTCTKSC